MFGCRKPWPRRAFLFAFVAFAIAACGRDETDVTKDEQGVTKEKIVVGASMPFSGPLAVFGLYSKGVEAYFNYVNDTGGVHGRKIEYKVYDRPYRLARYARETLALRTAGTGRKIKKDVTQCKTNKAPGSTSAAVVCVSITGSHLVSLPAHHCAGVASVDS